MGASPMGPGGQPPYYGTPGSEGLAPDDGRRRLRRLLLAGAAVVVVVAAIAGGILIGKSAGPTRTQTASETIPPSTKTSGPGTSGKINVGAIAARVDPAVVDILSLDETTGDEAAGTGMVLTSNGEVLTNNHVIDGGTDITAQLDGTGRTYDVQVLGYDPKHDVALVQLEGASGLPTVSIGNSSALKVGDSVVAIGNALDLKGPPTVTQGIVSALDRSITASDEATGGSENLSGLIQTDAPINPGNSGGPLVDAAQQVIGMDTAAATGSSTQSATNIGFAIPIDQAIAIAQDIQQGTAVSPVVINDRGFIGVQVISVAAAEQSSNPFVGAQFPTPGTSSGAYVAGVLRGTPAVQAGLKEGDVIISVDGSKVSNPAVLGTLLSGYRPGQSVTVTWVDTSGTRHTAVVALAHRPAD